MNDDNKEKTLTDIEERTQGLSTITLSVKQIRVIAGLIVLALFGSNGISGSGIWRWDKFGHKDFDVEIKPTNDRISVIEAWKAVQDGNCSVMRNRMDRVEQDHVDMKQQLRSHARESDRRFRTHMNRHADRNGNGSH